MTFILSCPYHPPYHWESFLKFLSLHLTKGIEAIYDQCYYRTVQGDNYHGWLKVSHCHHRHSLEITLSAELEAVQNEILQQIKVMFDLDHDPKVIVAFFQDQPFLFNIIKQYPGLRIPGSFNGFELAVRAILGQQISVKAATTLAGRIAAAFGTEIKTPWTDLTHLYPTASVIATLEEKDLTCLGIIQTRACCIIRLAQEITTTTLNLDDKSDPESTIKHLITLPSIGDWTAHYIALRALKWNDAFLKSDLAIRQSLGGLSASKTEQMSLAWQPWRSYATLYLWQKAIYQATNQIISSRVP